MSTLVTSLSSSYCFSCHERGGGARKGALLPSIMRAKKIDQPRGFLNFNANYGISMVISSPGKFQVKASSSPNKPSSTWKKWWLGILVTLVLPAAGYKGGIMLNLKNRIDKAVETVEKVAEVVEEVAEEAERLVEEVEEKLPGDSKLRETLESFEGLAKKAADEAKIAEDLVHKVRDMEEELEETMMKAAEDQSTGKKQSKSNKP